MSRLPVITGLGLVTPLGCGVEETWCALLQGRFITTHSRAADHQINSMALQVAIQALSEAQWDARDPTALVVGTSKGPVKDWIRDIAPPPHMPTPPCIVGGPNASFGVACTATSLAATLDLGAGPRLTLSAACASGLHALIRSAMMIRSGEADRVLVVAAEASVHPLFVASFGRLGVLPREGIGCRPFDEQRDGFLISEAAAAVCLQASARPGYAAIDRFALGCDATHLTGSDPSGETLRRLLADVAAGRRVDLVHAHATGTVSHDPIELAAVEATCVTDETRPIVYSHKGALGHSLGAAGLVSAVLNCMMHSRGVVPPNVRTTRPLKCARVSIPRETCSQTIRRSVVIAAGFGGATAALSLVS